MEDRIKGKKEEKEEKKDVQISWEYSLFSIFLEGTLLYAKLCK